MKKISVYIFLMAGLYLSVACSSFAQTVTPIPLDGEGKGEVELPINTGGYYYSISVPEGTGELLVELESKATGVELYLRRGSLPTTSSGGSDRAWKGTAPNKWLVYANPLPGAGTWYIFARTTFINTFYPNIYAGGSINVTVKWKGDTLFGEARLHAGQDVRIPVTIFEFDHSPIVPSIKTWAIVHGRNGEAEDFWFTADFLANNWWAWDDTQQVLLVDWSMGASDNGWGLGLLRGSGWIKPVGATAAAMLSGIGAYNNDRLHLVGHSWGAYVCYEISKLLGAHLLVALDPAAQYYDERSVFFKKYASHSWAFLGNGPFGSRKTALTAANSFQIRFSSINPWEIHTGVHEFFDLILCSSWEDFQPDGLVSDIPPWYPNPWGGMGFEGEFVCNVPGIPWSEDQVTLNIFSPRP